MSRVSDSSVSLRGATFRILPLASVHVNEFPLFSKVFLRLLGKARQYQGLRNSDVRVCKTVYPGSIPGVASTLPLNHFAAAAQMRRLDSQELQMHRFRRLSKPARLCYRQAALVRERPRCSPVAQR